MKRHTIPAGPSAELETIRRQRRVATTMCDVARTSRTTAVAMADSAARMCATAQAAVIDSRRQMSE